MAGSYSPEAGGNNYVFGLLGAKTQVVPLGGVDAAVAALMEALKAPSTAPRAAVRQLVSDAAPGQAAGAKPYYIPGGGSNALGALGYARAAISVVEEARKAGRPFDAVVLCSGSGGTHAGMLTGLRACGDPALRCDPGLFAACPRRVHCAGP